MVSQRFKLISRFAFNEPPLFRARARLTDDHLELRGWRLSGRYVRDIPLDQILHVDVKGQRGLILWLMKGEVIRIQVDQPAVWRDLLGDQLGHSQDP